MDTWVIDTKQLLDEWRWRAKRATIGHYEAAKKLDKRHRLVGGLLVVASALSTALAGRTLFGISGPVLDGSMTVLSVITLAIACLHVFLNDSGGAEGFRRSGAGYATVKREIEFHMANSNDGGAVASDVMQDLREKLDQLGVSAPTIPERVWNQVDSIAQDNKPLRY